MEPYDLAMLLVFAGTTAWGWWKGMAWQIASTASLIASYFVSLNFSPTFLRMMGWEEPWHRFLAMFILYVATSFGIWFVFRQVRAGIEQVKMKDFDHQIGGLLGAAKGLLLCLAITFFAVTLTSATRQLVLKSKSGAYMAVLLRKAPAFMPKELAHVLDPYLRRMQSELNQVAQPGPAGNNQAPAGPWNGPFSENQQGGGSSNQPWSEGEFAPTGFEQNAANAGLPVTANDPSSWPSATGWGNPQPDAPVAGNWQNDPAMQPAAYPYDNQPTAPNWGPGSAQNWQADGQPGGYPVGGEAARSGGGEQPISELRNRLGNKLKELLRSEADRFVDQQLGPAPQPPGVR